MTKYPQKLDFGLYKYQRINWKFDSKQTKKNLKKKEPQNKTKERKQTEGR